MSKFDTDRHHRHNSNHSHHPHQQNNNDSRHLSNVADCCSPAVSARSTASIVDSSPVNGYTATVTAPAEAVTVSGQIPASFSSSSTDRNDGCCDDDVGIETGGCDIRVNTDDDDDTIVDDVTTEEVTEDGHSASLLCRASPASRAAYSDSASALSSRHQPTTAGSVQHRQLQNFRRVDGWQRLSAAYRRNRHLDQLHHHHPRPHGRQHYHSHGHQCHHRAVMILPHDTSTASSTSQVFAVDPTPATAALIDAPPPPFCALYTRSPSDSRMDGGGSGGSEVRPSWTTGSTTAPAPSSPINPSPQSFRTLPPPLPPPSCSTTSTATYNRSASASKSETDSIRTSKALAIHCQRRIHAGSRRYQNSAASGRAYAEVETAKAPTNGGLDSTVKAAAEATNAAKTKVTKDDRNSKGAKKSKRRGGRASNTFYNFEAFCRQTSLHGWQYIGGDGISDDSSYANGANSRGGRGDRDGRDCGSGDRSDSHHGRRSSRLKHIFWFIIVCMSMAIATLFLYNNTKDFMQSTVVTTVDTMTVPLTEVFFPSVVVCNINQVSTLHITRVIIPDAEVRKSFFDELGIYENETFIRRFYHDYIGGGSQAQQQDHDDPDHNHHQQQQQHQSHLNGGSEEGFTTLFEEYLHRMNETDVAQLSINWVTHQKCKDMFLFSRWNMSTTYNFEIERDFGTDYGICCWYSPQLNFTDIINDMEARDLHEPDWGHWFTNIAKGTKTGKDNGYTMLFDIESFDYSYYEEGSEGLKVALLHHLDMPIMRQTGFHIAPGTESQIAVTPTLLTISDNAQARFTPPERDCYLEDEISLKYLPRDHGYRYEMSNCLFESAFENILKECKCFPGFHTMGGEDAMNTYKVCVGAKLRCMNDILNKMGQYQHVEYKDQQVRCRSSCENQINSLFVTTSSYPNRKTLVYREEFCIVVKRLIEKCQSNRRKPLEKQYPGMCGILDSLRGFDFCINNIWDVGRHLLPNCTVDHCAVEDAILLYARENLVILNIFIKDPYAKRFQKDEKITKTSYIANSGGLLGLCMGFSLISGAEILYHGTVGLLSVLFPNSAFIASLHEQQGRPKHGDDNNDTDSEANDAVGEEEEEEEQVAARLGDEVEGPDVKKKKKTMTCVHDASLPSSKSSDDIVFNSQPRFDSGGRSHRRLVLSRIKPQRSIIHSPSPDDDVDVDAVDASGGEFDAGNSKNRHHQLYCSNNGVIIGSPVNDERSPVNSDCDLSPVGAADRNAVRGDEDSGGGEGGGGSSNSNSNNATRNVKDRDARTEAAMRFCFTMDAYNCSHETNRPAQRQQQKLQYPPKKPNNRPH